MVIASDDRFSTERAEDGDVHFSFKSAWGETSGYFSYRAELPALLFTLGFDTQAPVSRRTEAMKLAARINENLWLGHFDVWADDGTIIFRHAMPMIGRDMISIGEMRAVLGRRAGRRRPFPAGVQLPHSGGPAGRTSRRSCPVRDLRRSVISVA